MTVSTIAAGATLIPPPGWNAPEVVWQTPASGWPGTTVGDTYQATGTLTSTTGYTLGAGPTGDGASSFLTISGTLTLKSPAQIDGSDVPNGLIQGNGLLVNAGLISSVGPTTSQLFTQSILTIGGGYGNGLAFRNNGTVIVGETFSQHGMLSGDGAVVITAALDPLASGSYLIRDRGTLEIASDANDSGTFDFQPNAALPPFMPSSGGGTLIIDNPGRRFDDVIRDFQPGGGTIVVRGIGPVGNAILDTRTSTLKLYSDAAATNEIYRFTNVDAGSTLTSGAGAPLVNMSAVVVGDAAVACFAAGTRIATAHGEAAIEALRPGDLVGTVDGGFAPVRWIGRRRIDLRRHPLAERARPIRIAAGAFGRDAAGLGMPRRELFLSGDHAVYADAMLVPVRSLINGTTIRPDRTATVVSYFHLELDVHQVILAEGLPAESWHDTGNRGMFENADVVSLAADFSAPLAASGGTPLVDHGPLLAPLRARLAEQAAALGHAARLEVDVPVPGPGLLRVALPPGTCCVRLVSPAGAAARDCRRLGVLISFLRLDGIELPLSGAHIERGFHAPERHGERTVCWTDGEAVFAVLPAEEERWLEVEVAASIPSAASGHEAVRAAA